MATEAELNAFAQKWMGAPKTETTNAPAEAQAQAPAVPQADLDAFASKWMPQSNAALGGVNAPPRGVTATPDLGFQRLYGRHDETGALIPIDESSGIPMGEYWRVSQQSDPEAKAQVLQKMYPDKKVRILDTGDVTLEVLDKNGKPKDVVINPTGIGPEDLIDLASQAPEIGASVATAIATRGRGYLKTLAQMVGSAFAGGFTGEVRDLASRKAEGIPLRSEEIHKERGAQVMVDLFGQGVLGTVGKATRALSPFARDAAPGSLAFNLRKGVDFLREKYGVEIPTTPGERTGNSALLAIEAAESPMPGSRNVVDKMRAKKDAAIQRVQQLALGRVTPEEQIGTDAIGQLRQRVVEPLESAVNTAREQAIQKGDKRIVDLIDDAIGTPMGKRVTPTEAGSTTLQAFEERLAQAQAKVDEAYAKVNALPGGSGDVLDGTAAADAAQAIRKELPKATKGPDSELLTSGIPEGLTKALDDLESLRGAKVSLQTLTNMKKAAYDAIAAFKTAHGDVKDRWFTKVANAYEQGIDKGIEATGNVELKNALRTARDTYKKEIVPLERTGIKELAKDEFDAGRLSPEQVMDRLFEGPKAIENYRMLKETLGADNPAFRVLKRAWADTKLSKFTDPITGTIDAQALSKDLKTLSVDRPELANELFGKNWKELNEALNIRAGVDKLEKLDESEIRTLLSLKDPTAADLRNLIKMSRTRDVAYVNSVFKDIADGIPLDDFQPTKFVTKLRNANVPTAQVQEVLGKLDPSTREAIATAEFYRILSESSIKEGETLARSFSGETLNLSPTKLVQALGKNEAEKSRTLLLLGDDLPAPGAKPPKLKSDGTPQEMGPRRVDVLEALVNTLAPKEAAKTVFSGLGSVSSATAVREMTRGPLKYASGFAKNAFLALAYMKGVGRALTNAQFDGEASAVAANTLIASEPILRASIETFGSAMTDKLVNDLKGSIDKYLFELNDSPEGRKRQAARQFIQGQDVPMKITPQ